MADNILKILFITVVVLALAGCTSTSKTSTVEYCESKFKDKPVELLYSCYMNIAVENLDSSICSKIPVGDANKTGCYAGIAVGSNNSDICNGIEASYKNNCLSEIANECSCLPSVAANSPEVCAQVKQMGFAGACE